MVFLANNSRYNYGHALLVRKRYIFAFRPTSVDIWYLVSVFVKHVFWKTPGQVHSHLSSAQFFSCPYDEDEYHGSGY
jgi:hypothetical protein